MWKWLLLEVQLYAGGGGGIGKGVGLRPHSKGQVLLNLQGIFSFCHLVPGGGKRRHPGNEIGFLLTLKVQVCAGVKLRL